VSAVRPPEPLCAGTVEAIVVPLGDHQVRVGVVLLPVGVSAGVDRQGVRQLFFGGKLLRERLRQGDLLVNLKIARQGEISAEVQAPVLTLVQIGTVPVLSRIVFSPRRHVVRFRVDRLVAVSVGIFV